MCGITGIINHSAPIDQSILQQMNRSISHRGPDDEGYFFHENIGLAHRRLSIIDLASGHQPMQTEDQRYIIVFNGEIYNFLSIKEKLIQKGVSFNTHSDTEVLLKLYVLKKEKCLAELNGMFSFAIWDKKEQTLFAARDRMGKKPFYYWKTPNHFAFSSEIKAFLKHPDFKAKLDLHSLSHFLQYEYVPQPRAIFEGVKKLPPASFLTWKKGEEPKITKYWEIPLTDQPIDQSTEEIQKTIITKLENAVNLRLVSDVPLGVFLSGGIDSSSIVALMARHKSGKDIKTFSIGFNEKSFDESDYANQIAKKFNTDHYQKILTPKKMVDILPEVVHFMDEPFADASIIPTYLLSKFTKEHVTVALGGDGSDEIFAGYPTFYAAKHAEKFQKLPSLIKKTINSLSHYLPVSHQDMSFDFKVKQFLYGANFPAKIRQQIWLGAFHYQEQKKIFLNYQPPSDPIDLVYQELNHSPSQDTKNLLLYFYQKFYLEGDILVKTDRASMAASLEVRAPYLDVDFVEYISKLNFHLKLKGKQTKYILKKALESILPENILYRPKKGFGIPISLWFKNDLKNELARLLSKEFIQKQGIFNPAEISRLFNEHQNGKANHRKKLFTLFMFQNWYEKYLK